MVQHYFDRRQQGMEEVVVVGYATQKGESNWFGIYCESDRNRPKAVR